MVRADGSEVRQVTKRGLLLPHRPGCWSPDGGRFYYLQRHPDDGIFGDVSVADIDAPGETGHGITRGLDITQVMAISPDGRYAACEAGSPVGGEERIYLVPLASASEAPILLAERSWRPAFSPDGKWMAFMQGDAAEGAPIGIWKKSLESKAEKAKVLDDRVELAWRNAWTAHQELVFTRDQTSLWVANDDGSNERKIFELGD